MFFPKEPCIKKLSLFRGDAAVAGLAVLPPEPHTQSSQSAGREGAPSLRGRAPAKTSSAAQPPQEGQGRLAAFLLHRPAGAHDVRPRDGIVGRWPETPR